MDIEKIIEIEKKLTELEATSTAGLVVALSIFLLLFALLFIRFAVYDLNKDK